ncbi:MAG: extracellular solute-binding protein, partial [bacterium]|nr:extracellular solute-binding protein [bacterium]
MQLPFVLTRSRIIMLGAAALVVILLVALFTGVIPGLRPRQGTLPPVKLTVWGVFDSQQVFTDLVNLYRETRSNVDISYRQFDPNTYEADLINALAAGTGPDIFMFQNTWLPKHIDKITAVSSTTLPYVTFRDAFPQVVSEQFAPNQIIYASPLYLDTLALFYNKDMFDKNSIALPPRTWMEFTADVNRLKEVNPTTGEILRAGAAIGGSNQSINRGTDILNLLMLQAGTQMVDSNFLNATLTQTAGNGVQAGLNSLNYYTSFANPSSPS